MRARLVMSHGRNGGVNGEGNDAYIQAGPGQRGLEDRQGGSLGLGQELDSGLRSTPQTGNARTVDSLSQPKEGVGRPVGGHADDNMKGVDWTI